MSENKIKEVVKKIFVEAFPELRREKFNFNKPQSDFRDWDSFMHMKLISSMEVALDVRLAIERTIDADSAAKFVEIIRDATSATGSKEAVSMDFKACKNFLDILDYWASKTPDKIFVTAISNGLSYSYADFNGLVDLSGQFLKKKGLRKGDIVVVCVRNSVEFLILYFATMRLGGIINLVPPTVAEKELAANITFLKPKLVFVEKKHFKSISKRGVIRIELEGEKAFLKALYEFPAEKLHVEIQEDDPSCLYYSSGTTANPKGILFSHKSLVNMAILLCREFGHNCHSIHFGILPMGHTSVMHHSLLPILYMGGTFIFSENFISVRRDFWRIIEEHRINYVQTVPTVIFMILNTAYPDFNKKRIALKYVACGSAPLPEATKKAFERKFGLHIANLYGLSEVAHMIDDYPFIDRWKPGMIGRPMRDVDVRILDNSGKEVKTGSVGEFAVKTPSLFMAYYKDKKLYDSSFKRGYFCTGDLGYRDKKGVFYFTGRKKDLIIKGGVNISPDLVDEVLIKHPCVEEVASIGKFDTFFGEVVKSFVVRKRGEKVSEDALFAYCKKKLGEFKSPSEIEFVDAIPKTFSGKILRRHLRGK